jgi:hypothetical protein
MPDDQEIRDLMEGEKRAEKTGKYKPCPETGEPKGPSPEFSRMGRKQNLCPSCERAA